MAVIAGNIKPILGALLGGEDTITMDQARYVAVAYAAAAAVGASIVTRTRVAKGKDPILTVLF